MKKINGILCIAIAVALLVGGVAAVSASEYHATINQDMEEMQEVTVDNTIAMTGDVGNDVLVKGNTVTQTINCGVTQTAIKGQLAGISQLGDYSWKIGIF